MRPHLTLHFEKLLQKKNADKKVSRKRVRPQYYGQALTSNEMLLRLQEDEKARKNKKRRKRMPSPEPEPSPERSPEPSEPEPSASESQQEEGYSVTCFL